MAILRLRRSDGTFSFMSVEQIGSIHLCLILLIICAFVLLCSLQVLLSGADEYVPQHIDKQRLLERYAITSMLSTMAFVTGSV